MSERVNPLANLDDFAVKPQQKPKPQPAAIDKLAQENGFPSRQPAKSVQAPVRQQRRYRTGRNVQIPFKGTPETRARIDDLADRLGITMSELLERAIDALERETKVGTDSPTDI